MKRQTKKTSISEIEFKKDLLKMKKQTKMTDISAIEFKKDLANLLKLFSGDFPYTPTVTEDQAKKVFADMRDAEKKNKHFGD